MARPAPRRTRTTWAALVLDAVGAVGLVLVAVGALVRGELLALVLLGALLGLAVVPGAVLSAVVLVRAARARRMRTSRIVLGVAGLAVCAALVGPAVLLLSWNVAPNPADGVLRPYEHAVESIGGRAVCANGDPGRGPDDVQAWREAYFTAPGSRPTVQRLRSIAAAAGYELQPMPTTDSPLAGTRTYGTERADGARTRTHVSVEVSSGGIPLRCGDAYGHLYRPAAGEVAVDLWTWIDPTT